MFYLVVDEAIVDEQLVAVAANAAATLFVDIHGRIEIRLWNSVVSQEISLCSSFRI